MLFVRLEYGLKTISLTCNNIENTVAYSFSASTTFFIEPGNFGFTFVLIHLNCSLKMVKSEQNCCSCCFLHNLLAYKYCLGMYSNDTSYDINILALGAIIKSIIEGSNKT